MSNSEDNLFSQLMSDVDAFEPTAFIRPQKSLQASDAQREKQMAAMAEVNSTHDYFSQETVEFIEPYDVVSFKKSGVQAGVFKNLRLGKYQFDASLELHDFKLHRAKRVLLDFLDDCLQRNIRVVLIHHGLGLKNTPVPAILKSYSYKWLTQCEQVLALHSALKPHGGAGAMYVLLTKSDAKKLENKELNRRNK